LRRARKAIALAEGIPAYAICTDEQLAAMAKLNAQTVPDLAKVDGFGEGKANKYGERLLANEEPHAPSD
jgi:superfamily II DNA helicase RecQ